MQDISDLSAWDAGNPLLAKLPGERSFVEMGALLAYDPRRKWAQPYGRRLESHAFAIKSLVVPTERSITLAMNLQSMLIDSLRRRDPRIAANRQRIFRLAELDARRLGDELERMPWFADGATGAIVRGPTGTSKSHSVEAFLRHIPQVIEHGPSEECGWARLKQLGWLRVNMPDDANRRSLYLAIVRDIDSVLGTNYYASFNDRTKNGPMLLAVIQLLTIHRCGLLVLEEAQKRNLGPQTLGKEFVVTFLRIMNSGVPIVLVGNPIAFENVLEFSQDLRRFTEGGIHNFGPTSHEEDAEWREDLVPSIWGWTLFDRPDEPLPDGPELHKLLYTRTGGSPSFLSLYRRECLVLALRRGGDRVELQDMDAAYFSPAYIELHALIEAYVHKDITKLSRFSDQPITYLETLWRKDAAARAVRQRAMQGRAVSVAAVTP